MFDSFFSLFSHDLGIDLGHRRILLRAFAVLFEHGANSDLTGRADIGRLNNVR
jgi:hypothetical protein